MVYEKLPGGRCLTNVSHNPSSEKARFQKRRVRRRKTEEVEVRRGRLIENKPGFTRACSA